MRRSAVAAPLLRLTRSHAALNYAQGPPHYMLFETTPHRCLQDASIVDLGGGTGNFTQALAEASGARRRVLCVDAFAEMLQKASCRRCFRRWCSIY